MWRPRYWMVLAKRSSRTSRSGLLESLLHLAISLFALSLIGLVLLIASSTIASDNWHDLNNGWLPPSEKYHPNSFMGNVDCLIVPCDKAIQQYFTSIEIDDAHGALDC